MNPPWMLLADASDDVSAWLGWPMFLIVTLPVVVTIVLARKNKKKDPYDDVLELHEENFEEHVIDSPVPVYVHFYRDWNIADKVMLSQTKLLAHRASRGDYRVGVMDIDENERVWEICGKPKPPTMMLFVGGEPIYTHSGLFQADELHQDMARTLEWLREEGRLPEVIVESANS